MRVLISRQAEEAISRLSPQDKEMASSLLKVMEAEHFPKLRAMLRSDYAADNGMLVRDFKGLNIAYKFLDEAGEQTVLVLNVFSKGGENA